MTVPEITALVAETVVSESPLGRPEAEKYSASLSGSEPLMVRETVVPFMLD